MPRVKFPSLFLLCLLLGLTPTWVWGGADDPKGADALQEQARQYQRAGQYRQALPLAHQALQLRYQQQGPEHPDIAVSLTLLGLLYQENGALEEALPLLQRALQIRYKALGASHPDTAASLNNLGELYRLRRSPEESLPLLERALRLREKDLGPEHPDTAASLQNLAAHYQDRGDYAKALPLLERALLIRERMLGYNHPDLAVSLGALAELHRLQGAYDKALPLAEKAHRLRETVSGPLHPATAQSLTILATVFRDMGFYGKAQPLYEQALQIRQKVMGLEHLATAQSLDNLGALYALQQEPGKSLPLLERAQLIRERFLPPDHPDIASSFSNLAALHRLQGAPGTALTLAQRALQIREKSLGPEHPDTLATLNSLATLHLDLGAPEKAISLYERIVQAKEKTLGPEHLDTAASLLVLAGALQRQSQYDKALTQLNRIWKIKEKAFGADHPETLASLDALAALYAQTGAYAKALPLYTQALQSREKKPGPDHPQTAGSLSDLARVHQGLGDYSKALELSQRALKINETSLTPDHPLTAATILHQASLQEGLEAYDAAQELCDRAIKMYEKSLGPEHLETAGALDALAGLYVARGISSKALPLFERSANISEKAKGPSTLETAWRLDRLASLYQAMGQNDKALPLWGRTARIYENALGPEHPDTSRVLLTLGLDRLRKNEPEKADEFFKRLKSKAALIEVALIRNQPEEAWQLLEGAPPTLVSTPAYQITYAVQRGQALAGVGMLPEAAVAYWQAVQGWEKKAPRPPATPLAPLRVDKSLPPYQGIVEVLVQISAQGAPLPPELQEFGPDPRVAAFSLAEAAKARRFLAALAHAPVSPSGAELSPEVRQRQISLQQRLAANEAQWEKAVRGGKDGLREAIDTRKKLLADIEAVAAELRLTQPLAAALYYPPPAPIRELPLASNEVVISYALGEHTGAIFVVRQDGVQYLHTIPLGRETLEARVREFLAPLQDPAAGAFSLEKGRELYELLLAKALASVPPSDRVIIIPDGILGLLPFEALVIAPGQDLATSIFVGDQRPLLYYPAAQVLAQQRGREVKPTDRPLLALGNPVLTPAKPRPPGDKKSTTDQAMEPPPPAPESPAGHTALATHTSWGPTTAGETGKSGLLYPPLPAAEEAIQAISQLFEGAAGPPDVLLGPRASETQLRQAPLPEYRYLHFGAHTEFTDNVQGRLEPFILLAQTGNQPPDDGFLTLNEVLALDLGAQMVVLAQGRTGQGQAMAGAGVIHLVRAFQYAGARCVLVNLWASKPELAQQFLKTMYGYLKDGKSPSEALWLARTALRQQHPNPLFWAGWVLYGEG